MAKTKQVHYHQHGRDHIVMDVLKEHDDGTVDIGPPDGPPVVTRCPIVDEPKPGHVTLPPKRKRPAKADGAEATGDEGSEEGGDPGSGEGGDA